MNLIAEKYEQCDEAAKAAVENCGRYLGIGLANLVNLCKPMAIVINMGEYVNLRPLIECAVKEMKSRAYSVLLQDLEIREVTISEENTVKGVAYNLCERLFDVDYPGCIV